MIARRELRSVAEPHTDFIFVVSDQIVFWGGLTAVVAALALGGWWWHRRHRS